MGFLLMKRSKAWGFIRIRHGPPTYNSKAHPVQSGADGDLRRMMRAVSVIYASDGSLSS